MCEHVYINWCFVFTFVTVINTICFLDVYLFLKNHQNTTKCSILHVFFPVYVAYCCLTKDELVWDAFLKLSSLDLQSWYKDM